MLTDINPKLPMRNKTVTRNFYLNQLDFQEVGSADYEGYLMVQRDQIQIHFFEFKELDPTQNYGQVYIRTDHIEAWYEVARSKNLVSNKLDHKPWKQLEFSILDPDNNLLTFGQPID
ncbi:hypothetical protein GCM10027347_39900 [Larkinella harenae]